MADPLSALGLAIQLGSLVKSLYDYGGNVKGAQKDIISLCAELSALKSTLELFSQHEHPGTSSDDSDFNKMLKSTEDLISELVKSTSPKSSTTGRVLQSFSWPFNASSIKEKLTRLERLKTWFLMAFALEHKVNADELQRMMGELLALVEKQGNDAQGTQAAAADRALLALIAPVSPDSAHRRACKPWQGTMTGSWFVRGELKAWLENDEGQSRIIMLSGRSGSGKTTLMSRAIEEAKKYTETKTNVFVAYFYCAFNDVSSRSTRNILGSWVAQLATQKRDVLSSIPTTAQREQDISIDELEDGLIHLGDSNRLLLILDAINESTDGNDLVDSINRLSSSPANINFLISSTPHYAAINKVLANNVDHISMLQQRVEQDIAIAVRSQISKHRVLSRIPAEEIIQALLPQSEGMFRWVDCQMELLASQLTPNAVRRALKSLPGSLDSTYEMMLQRVGSGCKDLVRRVLTWLSFCQRPLLLDELCEAIVMEEDQRNIEEDDRITGEPQELLALCQGLAEVNPSTGAVSLAHGSVRTFLTGDYIQSSKVAYFALDERQCSLEILRKCIAYLLMEPFKRGYNVGGDDAWRTMYINTMLDKYRLLDYVSILWGVHARSCELTDREISLLRRFFESQRQRGGGNFAFWICCYLPNYSLGALHESEPLYYVASFGLTPIVKLLLDSGLINRSPDGDGWYIDHKGGRNGSTALQVACYRGHSDIVALLLEAGADPNSTDNVGMSCITWADIQGHPDIVKQLQGAGGRGKAWRFHANEDGSGAVVARDGTVRRWKRGPEGLRRYDPEVLSDKMQS